MPVAPPGRASGGRCCAAARAGGGERLGASVRVRACPTCGTLWLGPRRRHWEVVAAVLSWGNYAAAACVPAWHGAIDGMRVDG